MILCAPFSRNFMTLSMVLLFIYLCAVESLQSREHQASREADYIFLPVIAISVFFYRTMAAFLDLVKLVTGIGDEESTTGHDASATKWVFVDEKDTVKILEGDKQEQKAHEVVDTEVTDPLGLNSPDSTSLASSQQHTETHNGKKSKSKKKKRKSRNRSNSIASSSKSVSWGEVEEILFTREQGIGAVPSSGLYPLGLGTEVLDARDIVSVDHHVSMGQVRLIERALKLGICVDQNDNEYECLETRQFDYRHGKNPLFHASNEDER